jgi:hypothetical protein
MKVTVQVIMTSDSGTTEVVHDVVHMERDNLQPETLDLTLYVYLVSDGSLEAPSAYSHGPTYSGCASRWGNGSHASP